LFFFEHENNKKIDNNKINKFLNILDKVLFYQNIRLLQFSW